MDTTPEHLKFDRSPTVAELVSRFNLQLLTGNSHTLITHVSTPKTASAGSFIFVYQDKVIADLPVGVAFICLASKAVGKSLMDSHPDAIVLICKSPRRISAEILTQFFDGQDRICISGGDMVHIDPSSSIDPGAVIGPFAVIGPGCSVAAGAIIGSHVVLGRDVHVAAGCRIGEQSWLAHTILGESVKLGQGSVIGKRGFGFDGQGQGVQLIPHLGRVIIGAGCDIGAAVCIDRGVIDDTCIGSYVMIDNQVHIAHNVCIGDNTIILAQAGIAGSVTIDANCVIGGQVGIIDHVSLCAGVTVASKSGVTKDIDRPGTYAGFPAEPARNFWAQQAALRRVVKSRKNKK